MLQALFPPGQNSINALSKGKESCGVFVWANLVQEDVTCCLSRSVTFCGTKIRAYSLLYTLTALTDIC